MLELFFLVIIVVAFVLAYLVSMYALAVYVDPDEIEDILPSTTVSHKKLLSKIVGDPRAFLQIAEIYKSFSLIIITILSTEIFYHLSTIINFNPIPVLVTGLIFIWFLYIGAVEILPRYYSRRAVNINIVRHLWLITMVYVLFSPIIKIYRRALKRSETSEQITEEEKEDLVERAIETVAEHAGIGETIVDAEEKEMINQIFLLDQTVVKEIMVPRPYIIGIEKRMTFKAIRELVLRDGHSRYPVYDEDIDKIIGLIYVKDLFNNMPEPGEEFIISDYLRKPKFIPETKIIGELLSEFKNKRQHIALVVDEYGGIAGLVTLEDIIEEILGEIQDEHDKEEAEIVKLTDDSYRVNANLMVEKLQDYLDTEYEQDENVSVGGMIYDIIGAVPEEKQIIKWHDLEFEIEQLDGQRIQTVIVKIKTPS